jgi:hypothetical protein
VLSVPCNNLEVSAGFPYSGAVLSLFGRILLFPFLKHIIDQSLDVFRRPVWLDLVSASIAQFDAPPSNPVYAEFKKAAKPEDSGGAV